MADPLTPNLGLAIPIRNSDVGTWDTPMNNNFQILDRVGGGTAAISVGAGSVALSPAQFQSGRLTLSSTLTSNVTITFPSSFAKSYTIQNLCTGSSAFTITLAAGGGQVICCPPFQTFDIWNDGANVQFQNFGSPIGGYWMYAGVAVPNWVLGCSIPPYLNCDGTNFSAATYPGLALILGGTTLPDSRGRFAATLNQGTARLNSSNSGFDGNTRSAGGGHEMLMSHAHPFVFNDPSHDHQYIPPHIPGFSWGEGGPLGPSHTIATDPSFTNITFTIQAAGSGNAQNIPPAYVAGLTLIRAG